jgi:hypothetical protein
MCSIRKAVVGTAGIVMAAAGVAGVGGCEQVLPPPSMRINSEPVVVDEAMQRRDWPLVTAEYANGVTVAGPTGQYFRADRRLPQVAQGAIETPLFVGQVALMPFDFLWDPPWEDVQYPRAQAPASYTDAPPTNTTY